MGKYVDAAGAPATNAATAGRLAVVTPAKYKARRGWTFDLWYTDRYPMTFAVAWEDLLMQPAWVAGASALVGLLCGPGLARWVNVYTERKPVDGWPISVATALLFSGFATAALVGRCQEAFPEVQPSEEGRLLRVGYHLALIALLIVATAVDLDSYLIPDSITISGIVIGVGAAAAVGELQLIHLWVDWNAPLVELWGPYIPEWIRGHPHLHGLAWSLTGLGVGAGITWGVRGLSSLILGREALGFGDVTLMGMIGSFLGWQPVLFVFLLAPFCGLIAGLAVKLLSNRPYVPYGPYLSGAAVLVLFTWRWLWQPTKSIFGDGQSLLLLGGAALAALIVLLLLLRFYRLIPGKSRGGGRVESAE